ncbi:M36 family metallopeptidase [Tenacibaculum sp. nBUS_03]|uniref:M36 family metallopeptidase n=1 Tax=Tenacibaculum sp. nBUS_03 TaxID=3395320 RepID=UPI003EBA9F39
MKKINMFVVLFLICQANFSQTQIPKDLGLIQKHFNDLKKVKKTSSLDYAEWKVTSTASSLKKGLRHYYLAQYHNGIPIVNGTYNLSIINNKVNYSKNQFINEIRKKISNQKRISITEEQAVNSVIRAHKLTVAKLVKTVRKTKDVNLVEFKNTGITEDNEPILVKKVYFLHEGELRLCWNVNLYEKGGKNWWNSYVDASSNKIISESNWVITCNFDAHGHDSHLTHDPSEFYKPKNEFTPYLNESNMLVPESYNVYAMPLINPDDGGRTVVTNPANSVASPFGWHDTNGVAGAEYTITRGNNVWAQEDANGNNGTGASPSGTI